MVSDYKRMVIVSNRLPLVLKQVEGGKWEVKAGSGGLVTAMAPVLKDRGGVWIGWPGTTEEQGVDIVGLMAGAAKESGYTLRPVMMTEQEKNDFYFGFANEVVWPLFHDLQSHCNFQPSYWRAYQSVNKKFARVIERNSGSNDYIWVNDYHLMLCARDLRELGVTNKIGFFLHIPFPPLDIFLKLPWRFEILNALLDYDLIGFQTMRDTRNFIQCIKYLRRDLRVKGKGRISSLSVDGRDVRIGSFPISIDFDDFANYSAGQEVSEAAWHLHEKLPERTLVLGVDRLDYTKGIPHRIQAFKNLLERYPDLHGKISLIQVVVPSREDIITYHELKMDIERLVGEVNGKFTMSGWIPIHYIFRSLSRIELLAYYRTCEIALITPLKDGMNLVAKEFCACSHEEDSVLILSEFAGAAAQLHSGAIMVNPFDIEGIADAIHHAYYMDKVERQARMKRLRRSIKRQDIFWWVDSFLKAGTSKYLADFPPMEDYVPSIENGR